MEEARVSGVLRERVLFTQAVMAKTKATESREADKSFSHVDEALEAWQTLPPGLSVCG